MAADKLKATFNPLSGQFDLVQDISTLPDKSDFEVEYRTITAPEAAAKALTLASTPFDVTKVTVSAIQGSAQQYAVDYTVSGTTLDWNGLGLDTLGLAAGDVLLIEYIKA